MGEMGSVCWCALKSGSNLPDLLVPYLITALRMLKVFYKHLITAAFDSKPGISHSSAACEGCENDIQIIELQEGLSSNPS